MEYLLLNEYQLEYKIEWILREGVVENIINSGDKNAIAMLKFDIYEVARTLIKKNDLRKDALLPKLREIFLRVNYPLGAFPE